MIRNILRAGSVLGSMALMICLFQNCAPYKALPSTELQQANAGLTHQMVKVFMASGHVARTVMSCDDGNSWIHDRSDNDATRCWVTGDPNYLECDHTPTSGHGIDAGDGYFFGNWGWGYNGSIRRSQDGVNWEVLRSDGWGGGVAYAKNVLLLMWYSWSRSQDLGVTWHPVSSFPQLDHPRLSRSEDTLFAMGRGSPALAISHDQGQTWQIPANFQPQWTGNIVSGNGTIVSLGTLVVSGNPTIGYEAYSTDGGVTWQSQQMFSSSSSPSWSGPIYNGAEFIAWGNGQVWQSVDGVTWTQTPIVTTGTGASPPAQMNGPVAFNPDTGTYAMIPNKWGHYYSLQQAYRSTDGIHWVMLDANHFTGGHPLFDMVVGEMDSSFCR